MGPQVPAVFRHQIGRSHVEYRKAAGTAFLVEPVGGPGVGYQYAGGEFRIGIQFQAEFDYMLVFILVPGDPAADHKAPVCQTAVVLLQFFLTDEVTVVS